MNFQRTPIKLFKNKIKTYEKLSEAVSSIQYWFDELKKENASLIEENKKLKSENYKDLEMAKMAEELKKAKEEAEKAWKESRLGFPMTKEENEAIRKWQEEHDSTIHKNPKHYHGAIGGNYIYEFEPTSIGTAGTCVCLSCRRKAYEMAIGYNGTYNSHMYREYMKTHNGEFEFQEIG